VQRAAHSLGRPQQQQYKPGDESPPLHITGTGEQTPAHVARAPDLAPNSRLHRSSSGPSGRASLCLRTPSTVASTPETKPSLNVNPAFSTTPQAFAFATPSGQVVASVATAATAASQETQDTASNTRSSCRKRQSPVAYWTPKLDLPPAPSPSHLARAVNPPDALNASPRCLEGASPAAAGPAHVSEPYFSARALSTPKSTTARAGGRGKHSRANAMKHGADINSSAPSLPCMGAAVHAPGLQCPEVTPSLARSRGGEATELRSRQQGQQACKGVSMPPPPPRLCTRPPSSPSRLPHASPQGAAVGMTCAHAAPSVGLSTRLEQSQGEASTKRRRLGHVPHVAHPACVATSSAGRACGALSKSVCAARACRATSSTPSQASLPPPPKPTRAQPQPSASFQTHGSTLQGSLMGSTASGRPRRVTAAAACLRISGKLAAPGSLCGISHAEALDNLAVAVTELQGLHGGPMGSMWSGKEARTDAGTGEDVTSKRTRSAAKHMARRLASKASALSSDAHVSEQVAPARRSTCTRAIAALDQRATEQQHVLEHSPRGVSSVTVYPSDEHILSRQGLLGRGSGGCSEQEVWEAGLSERERATGTAPVARESQARACTEGREREKVHGGDENAVGNRKTVASMWASDRAKASTIRWRTPLARRPEWTKSHLSPTQAQLPPEFSPPIDDPDLCKHDKCSSVPTSRSRWPRKQQQPPRRRSSRVAARAACGRSTAARTAAVRWSGQGCEDKGARGAPTLPGQYARVLATVLTESPSAVSPESSAHMLRQMSAGGQSMLPGSRVAGDSVIGGKRTRPRLVHKETEHCARVSNQGVDDAAAAAAPRPAGTLGGKKHSIGASATEHAVCADTHAHIDDGVQVLEASPQAAQRGKLGRRPCLSTCAPRPPTSPATEACGSAAAQSPPPEDMSDGHFDTVNVACEPRPSAGNSREAGPSSCQHPPTHQPLHSSLLGTLSPVPTGAAESLQPLQYPCCSPWAPGQARAAILERASKRGVPLRATILERIEGSSAQVSKALKPGHGRGLSCSLVGPRVGAEPGLRTLVPQLGGDLLERTHGGAGPARDGGARGPNDRRLVPAAMPRVVMRGTAHPLGTAPGPTGSGARASALCSQPCADSREWSELQLQRLMSVYGVQIKPNAPNFWQLVAQHVPGALCLLSVTGEASCMQAACFSCGTIGR
jgi:hypothetical protein